MVVLDRETTAQEIADRLIMQKRKRLASEYAEEQRQARSVSAKLQAPLSADDTTITLGEGGEIFGIGDIIVAPRTGEMIRVVGINERGLPIVVRGLGGVSAPLAEGDYLLKVAGGRTVEVAPKLSWRARWRQAVDQRIARAVDLAEQQVMAWRSSVAVDQTLTRVGWMGVGMAWGATLWSLL